MTNKKKRIIHSPEFRAETLKLAEKVGVAAVAKLKRLLAEQTEELDTPTLRKI